MDSDASRAAARARLQEILAHREGARPAPAPEPAPEPARAPAWERLPKLQAFRANRAWVEGTGLANAYFEPHQGVAGAETSLAGQRLHNFASYNYLGLSGHPQVTRAAQAAAEEFGTSTSASRIASGEVPLHGRLERALAGLLGVEAALLFVGGFSTNVTTIGHLLGPGDLVIHDALAHASIVQGATLAGCKRASFPHNDVDALDALLREARGRFQTVLIVVEGIYSMDGDICPLPELIEVRDRHQALLMVDEAHSIGVLGATGGGVGEHFGVPREGVDLWMGTLSKAFASCGGYLAGRAELIEFLRYTTPGFLFSVGMPPMAAAAAEAAMRLLAREPERLARLRARAEEFRAQLRAAGLSPGGDPGTPVVPLVTGDSRRALQVAQDLRARGINVPAVLHPAVDHTAARLRFFISSEHSAAAIRETARAVGEVWEATQPPRS